MNQLDALNARAVEVVRAYLGASDAERTTILRDLAEILVAARGHFYTAEGTPDWAGRTYAYRMWVREVYSAANVPPAQRTALQSATRWHIGTIVRERVPSEQLEAVGLDPKSPRERNVDARALRATARTLIGPGPEITDAEDLVAVAELFDVTLRRIPSGTLSTLSAAEQRAVLAAWTPVWETLSAGVDRFAKRH